MAVLCDSLIRFCVSSLHFTDARFEQAYLTRCRNIGNIPVPDGLPANLLAFERRELVDPDYWSDAGAIWIRTWYGDKAKTAYHPAEETATRSSADEAYMRLWRRALWPPDMHEFDDDMFGPYVFDDSDASYGVSAHDADDEVELMEEIPSFVLGALMRCPDAMEGSSGRKITQDEDLTYTQALLVVVADGEACEEGWVLLMAINDKGQVLHNRVRCKAIEVGQNVTFWKGEGNPLNIVGKGENVIDYRDVNQSGNGWDGEETS